MDEYLREIVEEALHSDDETDEEIPSEFYDERMREVRGAGSCSMTMDYERTPSQVFGWTVAKRRRIHEQIKILNDYHLMQRALATSCKQLCKAITPEKKIHLDAKPTIIEWQDVLSQCKGIEECF